MDLTWFRLHMSHMRLFYDLLLSTEGSAIRKSYGAVCDGRKWHESSKSACLRAIVEKQEK